MFSEGVRQALNYMMRIGCYFKIYPYLWDSKKCRLLRATRSHEWWFRIHAIFLLITWLFISYRLISNLKDASMPPRVRVLNTLFALGYGLANGCNLQFILKREEIMFFTNSLFEGQERWTKEIEKNPNLAVKSDFRSYIVVTSAILLYTNPTTHATVLFFGPCNPNYISSIIHNCESYLHIPISVVEAIPYFIYEYIIVADILFLWSFNWVLVFLGFLWVKDIMNRENSQSEGKVGGNVDCTAEYRYCQVLARLVNDAFEFYLQWFPSILFSIAGMLLFGSIRYTNVNILLYLVFPFCGLRCLFEATTSLAAAGMMNMESIEYLKHWGRKIDLIQIDDDRKYMRAFVRSCPTLQCTAGSMYTFENSIVLVSLDNCSQLTFNLLVTYK